MRLLPPSNIPQRVFALSIDLPGRRDSDGKGTRVTERLLDVCRRAGVAATWGLHCTASQQQQEIARSYADHEIAIAANFVAGNSTEMNRQVLERIDELHQREARVSTLVVGGSVGQQLYASLVRRGIRIVAGGVVDIAKTSMPVRTLRFGLWHVAATIDLADTAATGRDWKLRRKLDKIVDAGGLFHLAVGGEAAYADSTCRTLERLLDHVVRQRQRGRMTAMTMAQLAKAFATRGGGYAQSILRGGNLRRAA